MNTLVYVIAATWVFHSEWAIYHAYEKGTKAEFYEGLTEFNKALVKGCVEQILDAARDTHCLGAEGQSE